MRTWLLLGVLALVLVVAALAPLIAPYDPVSGDLSKRLLGVGHDGHLLGTDGQGRDNLSRLLVGARVTLLTGIIPVLIASGVGTVVGILAGMGSRRVNSLIMRILDMFYPFPLVLLAIAISAALGPSTRNVIISLSVVLIPPVARIVEGEVTVLKDTDFMRAAECSGASRISIAFIHILPNVRGPLLVYSTSLVGLSIVDAAGLSFLGLGVAPPQPEWGVMLNEARGYFFRAPDVALVPVVAILLTAILFNALGDRLRAELQPGDNGAKT